jgi:hypothetical protein
VLSDVRAREFEPKVTIKTHWQLKFTAGLCLFYYHDVGDPYQIAHRLVIHIRTVICALSSWREEKEKEKEKLA